MSGLVSARPAITVPTVATVGVEADFSAELGLRAVTSSRFGPTWPAEPAYAIVAVRLGPEFAISAAVAADFATVRPS